MRYLLHRNIISSALPVAILLTTFILILGHFNAQSNPQYSKTVLEQKIDSLFDLSKPLIYSNPDSARYFIEAGLDYAWQIDSQLWQTVMLNALGVSYLIQADYRNASDHLFKALRIAIALDNPIRTARTYNNLGVLSKEVGNHKDALYYYLQALNLYEIAEDESNRANVLNNISVLYTNLNNYEKALEYTNLTHESYVRLDNFMGIHSALSSKGSLYMRINQTDSSYFYLNKAIELAMENEYNYGLSNSYRNMAYLLLKLEDFGEAEKYLQQSKEISIQLSLLNNEVFADLGLAELYMQQEQYPAALRHAYAAMQKAGEMDNIKIMSDVHRKLSEIYKNTGEFDKAYHHYSTAVEMNEMLTDQNNLHQIYNMEIEKLSENIKISQLEVKQKELLISKRNTLIILIILVFLITVSILLLFYTKIRHKQKVRMEEAKLRHSQERSHAALEAEVQERKRLGLELHDGVGPLLSVAKLNVTALLQKVNIVPERKTAILENTLETINEVLREMKHISHNMAPIVLIEQGFEAAIKNLVTKLNETKSYDITLEIFGLNGSLDSYMEHALYRSILEIINNIIMHAQGSEITIQIIQNQEDITVMIEDNGVGFDTEALNNKGLGLKSTASRIESLSGSFFIDSAIGKGTIVTIIIPIAEKYEHSKN
jgi:two-component system, NarL family, sensor kinase